MRIRRQTGYSGSLSGLRSVFFEFNGEFSILSHRLEFATSVELELMVWLLVDGSFRIPIVFLRNRRRHSSLLSRNYF